MTESATASKKTQKKKSTTKGRKINSLELAGWGGGPGYVMSITLTGPMTVAPDPLGEGLLQVTTTAQVECPPWKAEELPGGHVEPGGYDTEKKGLLKKGTTFSFHSRHVRLMG